MLDKILYLVRKNETPLQLLQSVLSPLLQTGTMIASFHSSGNSFFFQIELINLWITERLVLPPNLIILPGFDQQLVICVVLHLP